MVSGTAAAGTDSFLSCGSGRLGLRRLLSQQLLLPCAPPAVAAGRAIGVDDTVAWDHQGHRIGRARPGDGPTGPRLPDTLCHLLIGACAAIGNVAQLLPDLALKRRGLDIKREIKMWLL